MNRCGLWMAVLLVAGAAVAAAQDVDTDYQALQDAVNKKDVATIKKLAAETSALARQEIAKPGDTPIRMRRRSASMTCTPSTPTRNTRFTLPPRSPKRL